MNSYSTLSFVTEPLQQTFNNMHYILRVIHETPKIHTIGLTSMVRLYFYYIFVEYTIDCNLN